MSRFKSPLRKRKTRAMMSQEGLPADDDAKFRVSDNTESLDQMTEDQINQIFNQHYSWKLSGLIKQWDREERRAA